MEYLPNSFHFQNCGPGWCKRNKGIVKIIQPIIFTYNLSMATVQFKFSHIQPSGHWSQGHLSFLLKGGKSGSPFEAGWAHPSAASCHVWHWRGLLFLMVVAATCNRWLLPYSSGRSGHCSPLCHRDHGIPSGRSLVIWVVGKQPPFLSLALCHPLGVSLRRDIFEAVTRIWRLLLRAGIFGHPFHFHLIK